MFDSKYITGSLRGSTVHPTYTVGKFRGLTGSYKVRAPALPLWEDTGEKKPEFCTGYIHKQIKCAPLSPLSVTAVKYYDTTMLAKGHTVGQEFFFLLLLFHIWIKVRMQFYTAAKFFAAL
jgi:hypothetical protein